MRHDSISRVNAGTLGAARRAKDWTQAQLAHKANVAPGKISAYERGKVKRQDSQTLDYLNAASGYEHGHFRSLIRGEARGMAQTWNYYRVPSSSKKRRRRLRV